jgi:hypothetical protein
MPQQLLSGEVEYIEEERAPDQVEMLRAEVAELRDELNGIKAIMLRQYSAYRQAFGEQTVVSSDSGDKWNAIKQRLPPRQREAVDILLLQGTMKRTQLASALRMDYSNCNKNVIGLLIRQGWMLDNNGNLSLKQL